MKKELTKRELTDAVEELSNHVQTLRDELLVMNVYVTALTEIVAEASINGLPITEAKLEKRRIEIGERIAKAYDLQQREQADAEKAKAN